MLPLAFRFHPRGAGMLTRPITHRAQWAVLASFLHMLTT